MHQKILEETINGTVYLLEYIPEDFRDDEDEKYCLAVRAVGADEEHCSEAYYSDSKEYLIENYIEYDRNRELSELDRTIIKMYKDKACNPINALKILETPLNTQRGYIARKLLPKEVESFHKLGYNVTEDWGVKIFKDRALVTYPFENEHTNGVVMMSAELYIM